VGRLAVAGRADLGRRSGWPVLVSVTPMHVKPAGQKFVRSGPQICRSTPSRPALVSTSGSAVAVIASSFVPGSTGAPNEQPTSVAIIATFTATLRASGVTPGIRPAISYCEARAHRHHRRFT